MQSLDSIKSLSLKGLTTQQRLIDSQLLLTSVDRDSQYAVANLARSRQTVQQAERELAMLRLDRRVAINKELQEIDSGLATQREALETAKRLVAKVSNVPASSLMGDEQPVYRYEITRKGPDGKLVTMAADELSPLLPGDVVRVTAQSGVLLRDQPLANN
jgi:hypothetical protein